MREEGADDDGGGRMRNFSDLTEREILALAIGRGGGGRADRISDFAEGLRGIIRRRPRCSPTWRRRRTSTGGGFSIRTAQKFGEHIPLVAAPGRARLRAAASRSWQMQPLRLDAGAQTRRSRWSSRRGAVLSAGRDAEHGCLDPQVARGSGGGGGGSTSTAAERHHAGEPADRACARTEDEAARRMFVLRVIQPGLAGLMDGSVSTLAPVLRRGVRHA
jgi:hypothetical protein